MSSTNKTQHYELPQWIAEDKPTFLGDFNKAFLNIDTNMYKSDTLANNADTNATNAINQVTSLNDIVTDNKQDITSLKASVLTAQNTANSSMKSADKLNDDIDNWIELPITSLINDGETSIITYCKYNPKLNLLSLTGQVDYEVDTTITGTYKFFKLPFTMPNPKTIYIGLNYMDVAYNSVRLDSARINNKGEFANRTTSGTTVCRHIAFNLMLCTADWDIQL